MVHFITKIINNPQIDDPPKSAPDVHKHFTRYSKGVFQGPIMKISVTKTGISLNGSFEYEDALFLLITKYYPEKEIQVTGKLIGSDDFTQYIKQIGLGSEWYPKTSKGQTQNYNVEFKTKVSVPLSQLQQLAEMAPKFSYCLLSFASEDKKYSLSIKKTPPRPNSKNPEDAKVENIVKFSSLKLPYSKELIDEIYNEFLIDLKDEVPSNFKSVLISNDYEIKDLILPKIKDSKLLRILTLRSGILTRKIQVDGKLLTNQINFIA